MEHGMDFHEAYTDTCSSVGIAARTGNLVALKHFLDEGKAADVKDNRGWFPLHEAAYYGHPQCLELLLKQEEVDVNWKAFEGETALLFACQQGHTACTEKLLKASADKDLTTNEMISPLFEACNHKNLDCARLLLEAGCKVNHHVYTGDTALHVAVERGSTDIVELLLQHKADVCACSDHNLTPVFIGAQYGRAECLNLLLQAARLQGKEHVVNMTASDNASPLLIASQNGYEECVEILLHNGADASLEVLLDGEDITMDPLQYAAKFGHERCLSLLLQYSRTDPQHYKPNELHPLRLVLDQTDISCLKLLVEGGFRIDQTFYDTFGGFGSLVCFSPSVQAAEFILHSGLDLTIRRPKPLHCNATKELNPLYESFTDEKLTSLFLKHGARITDLIDIWDRLDTCGLTSTTVVCYLMIKYGCKMKKCLHMFLQDEQLIPTKLYFSGLFTIMCFLTLNIETPENFLTHVLNQEEARLLLKLKAESNTLKHACRVNIVRHMIYYDQWDSECVEKLGDLPNIIQDYLKFKDYGIFGEHFMKLVSALKGYINGSANKSLLSSLC